MLTVWKQLLFDGGRCREISSFQCGYRNGKRVRRPDRSFSHQLSYPCSSNLFATFAVATKLLEFLFHLVSFLG